MLLQVSLWRLQLAFLNKRTNQDCIPFRKEASVIRYPRNVVFNHHGSTCGLGLESSDAVLCITCAQARSHNKLNWSLNMDLAFLSTGFSNWKDATRKFAQHESSKCHTEFSKGCSHREAFFGNFCQQTFSVLIAGTCTLLLLLFIGHGFFFGITFSLFKKCSFCAVFEFWGVFFYAKSVGFWGSAPDPHGGPYSAPPYPPPPPPSRGLRHLTLAAALFIPFLRHCTHTFVIAAPRHTLKRRRQIAGHTYRQVQDDGPLKRIVLLHWNTPGALLLNS